MSGFLAQYLRSRWPLLFALALAHRKTAVITVAAPSHTMQHVASTGQLLQAIPGGADTASRQHPRESPSSQEYRTEVGYADPWVSAVPLSTKENSQRYSA